MKLRANPDSEANIRRIDSKLRASKQTHGFQVHFLRGSESVTKMFSDRVYGGKENARRAARRFKRAALAELPLRIFRGPVKAKRKSRLRAKPVVRTKSKAKPKSKSAAKRRSGRKR